MVTLNVNGTVLTDATASLSSTEITTVAAYNALQAQLVQMTTERDAALAQVSVLQNKINAAIAALS